MDKPKKKVGRPRKPKPPPLAKPEPSALGKGNSVQKYMDDALDDDQRIRLLRRVYEYAIGNKLKDARDAVTVLLDKLDKEKLEHKQWIRDGYDVPKTSKIKADSRRWAFAESLYRDRIDRLEEDYYLAKRHLFFCQKMVHVAWHYIIPRIVPELKQIEISGSLELHQKFQARVEYWLNSMLAEDGGVIPEAHRVIAERAEEDAAGDDN